MWEEVTGGWKNCISRIRSFVLLLTLQMLVLVYEFREGEMMCRTCGTYGGECKCMQYFNGESGRQETTWKTFP